MGDRDTSAGTIIGAFLLGSLVGAAVALLTAPRSGKETRERIGVWAEGAKERTREQVSRIAHEAGDKVRQYGRETSDRIKEVAVSAREKLRRSQEAVDEPEEI